MKAALLVLVAALTFSLQSEAYVPCEVKSAFLHHIRPGRDNVRVVCAGIERELKDQPQVPDLLTKLNISEAGIGYDELNLKVEIESQYQGTLTLLAILQWKHDGKISIDFVDEFPHKDDFD